MQSAGRGREAGKAGRSWGLIRVVMNRPGSIGVDLEPGQELVVLFTAKDGLQSDIGYALEPPPQADASGAWSSTWKCRRRNRTGF